MFPPRPGFSCPMKKDLTSREDIDLLMSRFYSRATTDPVIGRFFTEVVKLDLEHHLPVIGDFWESTLLGTPAYRKHGRNPLQIHADIDRKSPLKQEHFDRWIELFTETLEDTFSGPRAEFTLERSRAIARRMVEFLAEAN
jgi:hemoglobin